MAHKSIILFLVLSILILSSFAEEVPQDDIPDSGTADDSGPDRQAVLSSKEEVDPADRASCIGSGGLCFSSFRCCSRRCCNGRCCLTAFSRKCTKAKACANRKGFSLCKTSSGKLFLGKVCKNRRCCGGSYSRCKRFRRIGILCANRSGLIACGAFARPGKPCSSTKCCVFPLRCCGSFCCK